MKSLILIIIFVYMLITLIVYIFQRSLLYFPTTYTKIDGVEEIYFKFNSIKLQGWVLNKGQEKALIYYGGNAENIEQNIDSFKTLFPNRTVYLINYRGYGKSQGNPTEKNLFADGLKVFDEIKLKHKSISLMGRSLGSGIASYISSKKEVEKLVLITPYDSILNVAKEAYSFLPVSFLLKDKYESFKYVSNIKASTLILYAKKDEVINPKRTKRLINEFKKEQISSVIIKNANHNDISNFKEYSLKLSNFLD
ncbi:alpha/beta hydrolase [Arcobacter sp. LA11]|uniref:alpha/beta hydrolase n=1 Tax=Arcobacter sp. LA11 TaxID=1898176 RepID=UPI000934BE40|nr:alpha/beta hydrolase [Arcobacter sp. LA11]